MQRSARVLESVLFAIASVAVYHAGPAALLFLLPLQVAASRRGAPGLLAAGLAIVMLAALRVVSLLRGPAEGVTLLAKGMEVAAFAALAGGLAVANLRLGGVRAPVRLLAATGVVLAVGVPLGALVAPLPAFDELSTALFAATSDFLRALSPAGEDVVANTLLERMMDPALLKAVVAEVLLRSFALEIFALLGFSWWAGTRAAARGLPGGSLPAASASVQATVASVQGPGILAAPPQRFASFRLESWWLWPLIGALALVGAELALAGRWQPAGSWGPWVSAIAWNAALITLFLFGLQGLAIVRFWFEKRGLPRLLWALLVLAVVAMLASPRLGVVVALALPLFGASETWVRWRGGGEAAPRPPKSGKERRDEGDPGP